MNSLRRAMLALARYSRWPRSDLRELTPDEFKSYFETAEDLIEDSKG